MSGRPAVFCLTQAGLPLARRIAAALPEAEVIGFAPRVTGADTTVATVVPTLRDLFTAGRPILGICAAGILVRALAPLLAAKRLEPAVLAIAEDGGSIVPLLGGHHGANALARRLGALLGGHAAITTAGDTALGVALDEPPPGWRVGNPAAAKAITAALLAGEPVQLVVESGDPAWLGDIVFAEAAADRIVVTHREPPSPLTLPLEPLYLHPPVLALGVGCERGASADELIALVEDTLATHGLAAGSVALVASIDLKADEPAVHTLAARLGVPARFLPAARLAEEAPRLANPSAVVLRETGCPGVAEGAALAAAGPTGALVAAKTKGRRTTCAVALARDHIDSGTIGAPRGELTVVGIGPGDAGMRAPDATAALARAEHIVGYGLYLDLIAPVIVGKARHATELGAEEERARLALDLAAAGGRVALVSSGDAGIYGLATLVFELLDREDRPDWRRVATGVVPGISAFQAAAARLGAPMGHDFCAISLSDLLTPWESIRARVAAAADGDFVLALYNPRSERRAWQLPAAIEIMRARRPADTPVALARNLGRDGETITVTSLAALDPAAVDMLTLVVVGSSATRRVDLPDGARLYTPRGYAGKVRGAS